MKSYHRLYSLTKFVHHSSICSSFRQSLERVSCLSLNIWNGFSNLYIDFYPDLSLKWKWCKLLRPQNGIGLTLKCKFIRLKIKHFRSCVRKYNTVNPLGSGESCMSAKLMISAQLKHMCSLPILISSSQRRASGGCPHFSSSTVVIFDVRIIRFSSLTTAGVRVTSLRIILSSL